jgi:hypothetical protein
MCLRYSKESVRGHECGNTSAQLPGRRPGLVERASSKLFSPKTTTFLLAAVPQFEGNPAMQSLVMCLVLITSGTATYILKSLLRAATFAHVGLRTE